VTDPHPHVAEEAIGYLSGELPSDRRTAVEAHLSRCEHCRGQFEAVRVALAALANWPREPQLPPRLERRLITTVRQRTAWTWGRRIAAAIALALAGSGGFAAGRASVPNQLAPAPIGADSALGTYLLLLEESEWPQRRPSGREGYTAWAQTLRAERRLVSAEKLTDESGFRVQPTGPALRPDRSSCPANVSGWFLLRARTYEDAIALARRGPHLRYGSVLVRQVE
jgi:predicted anti-sigma-YlaC factor YlaD